MSLISIQMEIHGKWTETRAIHGGEQQAFADQFRFRHPPDGTAF